MKPARWKYWLVIAGVLALAGAARAGGDEWSFEITPYAWLVNIDGRVSFEGREADFSADFRDLFDSVDFAGSLLGSVARGRWA